MRNARFTRVVLSLAALLAPVMRAQDKPTENKVPTTTLKVQVTFVESEGEKKLASLPYTVFVQAGDSIVHSPWSKVRMGSRVPIYSDKEGAMQYLDVGTNIDVRSAVGEGGKYDVALNLERSWVDDDKAISAEKSSGTQSGASAGGPPIIRQFKTEFTLSMKDGQTIQTTQAADPLKGRVSTIVVTMNVLK